MTAYRAVGAVGGVIGLIAAACSTSAGVHALPDGGRVDSSATAGMGGAAGLAADASAVDSTSAGGGDAAAVVDARDATDLSDAAGVTDAADSDAVDARAAHDATDAVAVDFTKILGTTGCGLEPGQALGVAVRATLQTSGVKAADCADSKCGAWSYAREYFLTLPAGYDQNKAYPLFLQGPNCGATGADVYTLSSDAADSVIRVGLTPPPNDIGHATNPGQGCFDDKEGDDSVDWVFYETLYDQLASQLCFDRHRVFVGGNGSGAWFADELSCKYAGDATRPVRGVLAAGGGLPTQPMYAPTCSGKPFAGMFFIMPPPNENALPYDRLAANHALQVDGCSMGTTIDTAPLVNFPIGGGNADTSCQRVGGCSEQTPLVVCVLAPSASGYDDIVNPGFSTFLELFEKAPLLSP